MAPPKAQHHAPIITRALPTMRCSPLPHPPTCIPFYCTAFYCAHVFFTGPTCIPFIAPNSTSVSVRYSGCFVSRPVTSLVWDTFALPPIEPYDRTRSLTLDFVSLQNLHLSKSTAGISLRFPVYGSPRWLYRLLILSLPTVNCS